ncbi:MAG: UDP-N-acetylmuramate dehydrogenase [Candidatus Paceibacterota bacterium]|jgi:UDP-N-acetylmuramate dehydrogenase
MKLETNFLLSKITTFELGGPARFYLKVSSPEEAVAAVLIAQDKKIKHYLVGGGSNLVFADKGFLGLVIHWLLAKPKLADLKIVNSEIVASAGVRLADLIKFANKNGLAGLEKLAGVPGVVGGAVVGNAEAYGQSISDYLTWVEIFDGEKIRRIAQRDCQFKYRESIFKHQNWLLLRVGFKLKKGKAALLIEESKKITKIRWAKFGQHPICAGSFFKNVMADGKVISTASLIEQAGIADLKRGGVRVAPWHHNFLINDGTGTTSDLLSLAKEIKKIVHKKLGIKLEEEVRFVLK